MTVHHKTTCIQCGRTGLWFDWVSGWFQEEAQRAYMSCCWLLGVGGISGVGIEQENFEAATKPTGLPHRLRKEGALYNAA